MLCSLRLDDYENRAPQGPSGVLKCPDLDDYEKQGTPRSQWIVKIS